MDQITIRASSLGSLFDCPAQWEAKHIQKMWMPRSPRSLIGNAVHEAAAAYDAAKVHGSTITINEAASVAVDYIKDKAEETEWIGFTPQQVESKALALHALYCAQIAPQFDFVSVEASCEPIERLIDDVTITITGTPDRVYQGFTGGYGGLDVKTGYAILNKNGCVQTSAHITQMACYELMLENEYNIEMDEPFVIAGLSTANTPACGMGYILNAKKKLFGDPNTETKGFLHYAASIIKGGNFYGNPKSMTCTAQYCPKFKTCQFRG